MFDNDIDADNSVVVVGYLNIDIGVYSQFCSDLRHKSCSTIDQRSRSSEVDDAKCTGPSCSSHLAEWASHYFDVWNTHDVSSLA